MLVLKFDHADSRTVIKPLFSTHFFRCLRALVLVVLAGGVLTSCAEKKLTALAADDVILAFGDSLTEGKGVPPTQSYPAVLEQISGFRIINAGRSGETTAQGLRRLPGVLDEVQPRLMLLLHGGNDILQNLPAQQAADNIAAMIRLARARGIDVVLIGVPEKNLFSEVAPIYPALAEQFDLVFEPSLIASLLRSPSKKSDSVHFNQQGYREIAESLSGLLESAGAL